MQVPLAGSPPVRLRARAGVVGRDGRAPPEERVPPAGRRGRRLGGRLDRHERRLERRGRVEVRDALRLGPAARPGRVGQAARARGLLLRRLRLIVAPERLDEPRVGGTCGATGNRRRPGDVAGSRRRRRVEATSRGRGDVLASRRTSWDSQRRLGVEATSRGRGDAAGSRRRRGVAVPSRGRGDVAGSRRRPGVAAPSRGRGAITAASRIVQGSAEAPER